MAKKLAQGRDEKGETFSPARPDGSPLPPSYLDGGFLGALVDSTRDFLWVVDPEKFELLWWNRSLSEFLRAREVRLEVGLSSDGSGWSGMRCAELRAFYERAMAEGPFEVETQLGPSGWLDLSFVPLVKDGQTYAILVAGHDATGRKRAELEREAALRRLADEERLLRPGLAVLYMSGYSRDSGIHGGRLGEEVSFLQKPFTPSDLVTHVDEALAGRQRPGRSWSKGRARRRKEQERP